MSPKSQARPDPRAEPAGCGAISNPQTGLLERQQDGRGLLSTFCFAALGPGVTGMGLVPRIKDSDNTQQRLTPILGG